MRVRLPKKQIIGAFVLLTVGLICAFIQNTFYGYVDEEGVLNDSLFLPLSVLFFLAGSALLIAVTIQILFKIYSTKANKEA